MAGKKLVIPAPIGAGGEDVTTWALPEGAIARLERGGVGDMEFSPDGHYLAVATKIGLWWYELATMAPVALWDTERGMLSDVVFSPNGKWIATANWDKILKVWDVQQGLCVSQIELGLWDSFTFLPDNRWLAIGNRETANVDIWHPETSEIVTKFTTGQTEKTGDIFMPVAFSPDTQLLASTSHDDTDSNAEFIIVWDMESGEQVACLTGHTGCVYCLCFSPCSRFLTASGKEDGTVRVWDVARWQQIKVYTGYGTSDMIPSYSPEGVLRAAAIPMDEDIVTVWDLERNEKLYTANSEGVVTFSSGSQLAYQYGHQFLEVWTVDNPKPRRTLQTHISFVDTSESMIFSQDGKTIAAEYRSGEVLLWDIVSKQARPAVNAEPAEKKQHLYTGQNGKNHVTTINTNTVKLWAIDNGNLPIAEFTGHEDKWVRPALAPAANLLACTDKDGNLNVWNVQTGAKHREFVHTFRAPEEMGKLVLSPDGRFLASENETYLNAKLWDVEQGLEICEFPGYNVELGGFSPCGRYLLIHRGGREGNALWDVEHHESISLKYMFTSGYFSFAYSPCGTYLAACGEEEPADILIWDIDSQDTHIRIRPPNRCKGFIALAFSQCGLYLAGSDGWQSGYEKLPICLWEVETGKHIVTFWGHSTDVHALAFAPNNQLLASASFDGSILLWALTPYL